MKQTNHTQQTPAAKKRKFFMLGGAGALALAFSNASAAPLEQPSMPALSPAVFTPPDITADNTRVLSFYNLHTNESLTVTYWQNGEYSPEGLQQMAHFMRDFRLDREQPVNPRLLDALYTINRSLSERYPNVEMRFQVISGFRARETTARLRAEGHAVARDTSQHQFGNAMDVRIEGVPLRELRDTAWCLQQGGVGYYPTSGNNFVHVDVGRVRFWSTPASNVRWRCMS